MRLEIASRKAIEYACKNFHYAKIVPAHAFGFSVFNIKNEWCGVITYGGGAGAYMGSPYGLTFGKYLELNRMALNGKQESTSKAMSISIKLIKKMNPTIKLLISYADKGQNHLGIIYQSTNWYFVDESESSGEEVYYKGKWSHNRTPSEKLSKENYRLLKKRVKAGKYKYLYPLTIDMKELCEKLKKPYPKKSVKNIESDVTPFQEDEGGATPTLTHQ